MSQERRGRMSKSKKEEFIDELKFSLDKSDLVKSIALLRYFSDLDEKAKMMVLFELSKADDNLSFPLLGYLATIGEKEPVKGKLYELLIERAFGAPHLLEEWLADDKIDDKTIFVNIAGELQMETAVSLLEEILNSSMDNVTIISAIKALGLIASPSSMSGISEYLYSNDFELVYVAIRSLGEIGGPTVVKKLSEAVGRNDEADFLILDIMASNQDQDSLQMLNEMLMSHFSHLRNRAKDHLVKIGKKAVPILLENLKQPDPDLLIHTLNILGLIGDPSVDIPIRKLLQNEPPDANVRFAAYEALGFIRSARSAMSLANGLNDPVYQVRIAAAKAIDRNISDTLLHGLKNLVEPKDEDAKNIVGSFIDAEADQFFDTLIGWTPFQEMAVEYLTNQASEDIRDHFVSILRVRGDNSLADAIMSVPKEEKERGGLNIYVVDDSKLMLNIYTKKLNQLGYEPVLFQYPAEAIEAATEKKPDILITDLNMPEINGLQLTEKIREKYPSKQLPIMMITTQSDVEDEEVARKAGIDIVLHKPFSDDDLKENIEKLTNQ